MKKNEQSQQPQSRISKCTRARRWRRRWRRPASQHLAAKRQRKKVAECRLHLYSLATDAVVLGRTHMHTCTHARMRERSIPTHLPSQHRSGEKETRVNKCEKSCCCRRGLGGRGEGGGRGGGEEKAAAAANTTINKRRACVTPAAAVLYVLLLLSLRD